MIAMEIVNDFNEYHRYLCDIVNTLIVINECNCVRLGLDI